jgi:hypothetical protein
MTSAEGATDGSPTDGADGEPREATTGRRLHPTPVRIAVVGLLLVLCFFVARTCQQAQIRVTQDQAIATAKKQIGFTPKRTQVRLLRQGLDRRPFWIVSLSIPTGQPDTFSRLALVRIDANTGKVESVQEQEVLDDARKKKEP